MLKVFASPDCALGTWRHARDAGHSGHRVRFGAGQPLISFLSYDLYEKTSCYLQNRNSAPKANSLKENGLPESVRQPKKDVGNAGLTCDVDENKGPQELFPGISSDVYENKILVL